MKILHVAQIHWYNAEVQYAWDLAVRMNELGHEAHGLTRPNSIAEEMGRKAGLTLGLEDGFNGKGLAMLNTFIAGHRFKNLLKHQRYDAVVIHRSEGMALMAAAARQLGIPAVRVRGDMRPVKGNFANRGIYRSLLSGVVATNTAIARSLKERVGVKAEVIYGGVDEKLFTPEGPKAGVREELGLEKDAFLVGILGRMVPLKGHMHLLDAAEKALKEAPNLALVLLVKSDRELLPEVREKIARSPRLAKRVKVMGHRDDLPAVLRDFDLGVVASTASEANCRVGLEWMASGTGLLASDVGVLPDLVDQGVTGYVTGAGMAFEMADKLVYLAGNPQKTKELGEAARERVQTHFTLDAQAARFIKYIKGLG